MAIFLQYWPRPQTKIMVPSAGFEPEMVTTLIGIYKISLMPSRLRFESTDPQLVRICYDPPHLGPLLIWQVPLKGI